MPSLQQILEALKLAPRYLAAIGLFCGLILLSPDSFANALGIRDLAQSHRQWLGITFLGTLSLLAVNAFVKVGDRLQSRKRHSEACERTLKRLHNLTEEEKQVLRCLHCKTEQNQCSAS